MISQIHSEVWDRNGHLSYSKLCHLFWLNSVRKYHFIYISFLPQYFVSLFCHGLTLNQVVAVNQQWWPLGQFQSKRVGNKWNRPMKFLLLAEWLSLYQKNRGQQNKPMRVTITLVYYWNWNILHQLLSKMAWSYRECQFLIYWTNNKLKNLQHRNWLCYPLWIRQLKYCRIKKHKKNQKIEKILLARWPKTCKLSNYCWMRKTFFLKTIWLQCQKVSLFQKMIII